MDKYIIYSLLLTLASCGLPNEFKDHIESIYHGPELMETIDCQWYTIVPIENTLTLHREIYSDGHEPVTCTSTVQSSDIRLICNPYSDISIINYIYIDGKVITAQVLYDNTATCTKTFTQAKPSG